MKFERVIAMMLLLVTASAMAERVQTYWRLEPVDAVFPRTASLNMPFFEQRLLPVAMASLNEDVSVGQKVVPKGTLLYEVFNDSGKVGFCTIKDRSPGHLAHTLFIPMADQRPCFVDDDHDGLFDRVFFVFDKEGGPPSVRGSIDSAEPLLSKPAFHAVDIHNFPSKLTVSFVLSGKESILKSHLRVHFSETIGGDWYDKDGTLDGSAVTFKALNTFLILSSIENKIANIKIAIDDTIFLSTDNRNNLYMRPLPSFLTGK